MTVGKWDGTPRTIAGRSPAPEILLMHLALLGSIPEKIKGWADRSKSRRAPALSYVPFLLPGRIDRLGE